MLRALIELLFTVFAIIVARAVIGSILKTVAKMSVGGFRNQTARGESAATSSSPKSSPGPQLGGELHKDPVCGTYVAESAALRRQIGGRTIFYCSEDCRQKDAATR
jgi:hypothetical protein